ncbi:MAG: PfkB family carbohydrate kinase [Chloroflexota bacterium]|mgnify:CR=1 FL=1|nr:MAG: ribokinase [Chloroflexota bacterium]
MAPDYLLLGHFTRDLLPDGSTTPGGTAMYSSLTAHRLGARVAVVSAPAPLPAEWPAEIEVAYCERLPAPTFENRYTPAGRVQILHAAAGQITLDDVPAEWRSAPVIHLGPVAAETSAELSLAFPDALVGMTPQGLMREWREPLPGPVMYRPWRPEPELLRQIDVLVLSIEDVRGDESLAIDYARHCRLVALTRGAAGSTLFIEGKPHPIAACPADERDPTGAGDVFAAALFVRLHETGDPIEAANFAACVAGRSVEGPGASAIPTRAEVNQRRGQM